MSSPFFHKIERKPSCFTYTSRQTPYHLQSTSNKEKEKEKLLDYATSTINLVHKHVCTTF